MGLPSTFSWDDLPERVTDSRNRNRAVSGQSTTIARFELDRGADVGQHHHPHEQVICVLSGRIDFKSGEKQWILAAGDGALVPSNVPHGGTALEDTVTLEFFSPPRPDLMPND